MRVALTTSYATSHASSGMPVAMRIEISISCAKARLRARSRDLRTTTCSAWRRASGGGREHIVIVRVGGAAEQTRGNGVLEVVGHRCVEVTSAYLPVGHP